MKYLVMLLFAAFLSSCGSGQGESYAHITQRRVDSAGKVMITYRFQANGSEVLDSMEVGRAMIVPHDSVKVIYTPGNPSESRLVLP